MKRLDDAKTRLRVDLPASCTQELALAFASDTVEAARGCPLIDAIGVVTDDARVSAAVVEADDPVRPDTGVSCAIIGDPPGAADPHNAAIDAGLSWWRRTFPEHGCVVLSADLPAVTSPDLTAFLAAGRKHGVAVASDLDGDGTVAVTLRPREPWTPAFGPDSYRRHQRAGAAAITVDAADRLRRDVDVASHLAEAMELGVGRHTRRVLEHLCRV